jgi:hypothetical protein
VSSLAPESVATGSPTRPDRDAASPPASRLAAWTSTAGRRVAGWLDTSAAFDVATALVFVAFAFWLFHGLWPDPGTRVLAENVNDQALNEWFLAHGVTFWTGDFSLVTSRLNAPDGVNLMSNASDIFYGVTMAPLTALFGPAVTFTLLMALNLAGTATGWYLLLARTLKLRRGAALVGGAIAGFGPGMIGQSNGHLHITAQWLVPLIVYWVIRLTRVTTPRGILLTGLGLALSVCAQLFVGEEVLFLAALGIAVFGLAYAVRRPRWTRQVAPRLVSGLLVAGALSVALLAYPLWVQFAGRMHTPNAPFEAKYYYADLATYFLFSPLSIAGSADANHLSSSPSEFNTYLGLPLIILVIAVVAWRFRSPVVMAGGAAFFVIGWLSLGPTVTIDGEPTDLPSLYTLLHHVPVVDSALPTRYALVLLPLSGVLLAYATHEALGAGRFLKYAVPVAVAAALLPCMPVPLATTAREPVPGFITSGAWRQCVPAGGVMVVVPAADPGDADLMRWPAKANAAFAIPQGFFIGPYGAGGRTAMGIYPRPTAQLLTQVSDTGQIPPISDAQRVQARADLDYWKADCVALAPVANEPALRATLDQLFGPGKSIVDIWTWKITR